MIYKFGSYVKISGGDNPSFWNNAIGVILDGMWNPMNGRVEYKVRMFHPEDTELHYDTTFEEYALAETNAVDYMKFRKRNW